MGSVALRFDMIIIKFPFRLESPNKTTNEHWSKRHARNKKLERIIRILWRQQGIKIKPPCEVFMCRIAPRSLDSHDNLPMAFKCVTDVVSSLLIPGKAKGQADSSNEIAWHFEQRKGTYAVEIKVIQSDHQPTKTTKTPTT